MGHIISSISFFFFFLPRCRAYHFTTSPQKKCISPFYDQPQISNEFQFWQQNSSCHPALCGVV